MKRTIDTAKVIVLGAILALGMNYLYAAWSAPTVAPPGGNAAAPINTSAAIQNKLGPLGLTDLVVSLSSTFNGGVQITQGAGLGRVLTSDASGNASWQPTGALVFGDYATKHLSSAAIVTYTLDDIPASANAVLLAVSSLSDSRLYVYSMSGKFMGGVGVRTGGGVTASVAGGQLIVPVINQQFKYKTSGTGASITPIAVVSAVLP